MSAHAWAVVGIDWDTPGRVSATLCEEKPSRREAGKAKRVLAREGDPLDYRIVRADKWHDGARVACRARRARARAGDTVTARACGWCRRELTELRADARYCGKPKRVAYADPEHPRGSLATVLVVRSSPVQAPLPSLRTSTTQGGDHASA